LEKDRIKKLGWSIEEALAVKVRKVKPYAKPVVIDGRRYSSQNEAARALGISVNTFRNRIAAGLSPKQASEAANRSNILLSEVNV